MFQNGPGRLAGLRRNRGVSRGRGAGKKPRATQGPGSERSCMLSPARRMQEVRLPWAAGEHRALPPGAARSVAAPLVPGRGDGRRKLDTNKTAFEPYGRHGDAISDPYFCNRGSSMGLLHRRRNGDDSVTLRRSQRHRAFPMGAAMLLERFRAIRTRATWARSVVR